MAPGNEATNEHADTFVGATLDSDPAGSPWSRRSFGFSEPRLYLRCDAPAGPVRLYGATGRGEDPSAAVWTLLREWADPFEALAWMEAFANGEAPDRSYDPAIPGSAWVGYLSYELGRLFERAIPAGKPSESWPLFEFRYHDGMWPCENQLADCTSVLPGAHGIQHQQLPWQMSDAALCSNFTRAAYESAVSRAREYIAAGDVFQVNLSQRLSAGLREHPRAIYRRLQRQSPAWFGAYLEFPGRALLCNSPELFLRVTSDPITNQRRIITRPIKGTRPRGPGMETQLRDSLKDQAELNMIVDLERNDLGRVCEIGSVKVTQRRTIEAHPTLFHGAATVEGMLRDDVSFVDLLRATFPGGSITGAPKIRAMQIIDELEPSPRGPYCGAIGYLATSGDMQFNIAIRTMIVEDATIHIPVGGGIVADSDAAAEYEETLHKARAMLEALGLSIGALNV